MKIESKHGTKIPAYALGAALLATTTLLTGCPMMYAGGMDVPPTSEEEVVYEGGLEIADEDCTTETSADTILSMIAKSGPTGTFADFCDSSTSAQFEMFMNKIDEIEAAAPGEFKYNITAVRDREYDRYFFILSSYQGMNRKHYVIYDGVLIDMADPPYYDSVSVANALDYESIKMLPFLVDTEIFKHTEVNENGVKKKQDTPIVSNIDDGDYYGEIIGFSQDGTKVLLKIGKPVIFTADEIEALKPGDPIGYKDFVIVDEKISYNEKYSLAKVKSESYPDCGECYVSRYYNSWTGDTNKAYLKQDMQYWVEDTVIVEMPLSEDCKVFNTAECFELDEDLPDDYYENGFHMKDSYLFQVLKDSDIKLPNDNGWYETVADTQSIIIENGEVTRIEMYHPLKI